MNTANWIPDLFMKRMGRVKIGPFFAQMKYLICMTSMEGI